MVAHRGRRTLTVDHRLFLDDRQGNIIINGGYNVYPSEVENVILAIRGIPEVVSDDEWGK